MNKLANYLDDVLILAGCGLLLAGTWNLCPAATWFVGGVECIVLGVLVGVGGRKR